MNGDLDRVVAWLEWWVWLPVRAAAQILMIPVGVALLAWWVAR